MDQDPPNRRGCVRQRIHSPAYVSVTPDAPQTGSGAREISDISVQGLSFRSSTQRAPGESLQLRLNLAESGAPIETAANVAWSDASGRTGVRFQEIHKADLLRLERWLFANAIAAFVNYQAAQARAETSPSPVPLEQTKKLPETPESSEYATILITLADIRRQIGSAGMDRALDLLVEHARTVTCASGAAIAVSNGQELICRASSGASAPSLGAHIGLEAGFSGECVRRGQLLHCHDAESDPVVDRESCRVLGVRSIMAMPVRYADQAVGLLEVFSPLPGAFRWKDEVYLRRLSEMVLGVLQRSLTSLHANTKALQAAAVNADTGARPPGVESGGSDSEYPGADPIAAAHAARARNFLLVAIGVLALILAVWFAPAIRRWFVGGTQESSHPAAAKSPPQTAAGLDQVRTQAQQGDASAQFDLGARYAVGDEVAQDYHEAARWFTLAADQGHVTAQAVLGAYYSLGRGVPKDIDKAYYWSVLAKAGGDEASKYRIPVLASQLSRNAVLADQELANEWIRQHQLARQGSRD